MRTKLVIEYDSAKYELDLYEDTSVNLNFSVSDIRDISSNSTPYSKTITLPGTSNNNKVFKSVYNVGATTGIWAPYPTQLKGTFLFEYPVPATLYSDSIEIFYGHLYLGKVLKNYEQEITGYEVSLLSSVGTLFGTLGDKKLAGNDDPALDLNFSKYDHALHVLRVVNSWMKGSAYKTGYYYQGMAEDANNKGIGSGYVYPLINYADARRFVDGAPGIVKVFVDEMRPSLFHKEILDEIFKANGYTYSSKFLNSDTFKRMIFPATKPMLLSQAQADLRNTGLNNDNIGFGKLVDSGSGKTDSWFHYGGRKKYALGIFTGDYAGDSSSLGKDSADALRIHNNITDMHFESGYAVHKQGNAYVVPSTGKYDVRLHIDPSKVHFCFAYTKNPTTNLPTFHNFGGFDGVYKMLIRNLAAASSLRASVNVNGTRTQDTIAMNPITYTDDSGYATIDVCCDKWGTTGQTQAGVGNVAGNAIVNMTLNGVLYNAGDVITPELIMTSSCSSDGGTGHGSFNFIWDLWQDKTPDPMSVHHWITFDADAISFTVTGLAGGEAIKEGDIVGMNQVLECGMTQAAYVQSLAKAFNLMFVPDKYDSKKITIEPRNNFISDMQNNMTDDGYYSGGVVRDWTKKLDKSSEFTIEQANDVLRKNNVFSFAQDQDSYNKDYYGREKEVYGTMTRPAKFKTNLTNTITTGFAATPQTDYNGTGTTNNLIVAPQIIGSASVPRLLYWAGLTYPKYSDFGNNNGLRIYHRTETTNNWFEPGQNTGMYGYAGHITDLNSVDSWNVLYAAPTMFYNGFAGWMGGSLYSRHYMLMMEEYTDENSRLITAYFYLNNKDINELDYRDKILVDGIYYRINKIIDYSPSNAVTKVELLKILYQFDLTKDFKPKKDPFDTYFRPEITQLVDISLLSVEGRVVIKESRVVINNTEISVTNISNSTTVIGPILDLGTVIDAGSTVINGNVFDGNGHFVPVLHVIDGGRNDAPMEFCEMAWEVMDGGYNSVRSANGVSYINKIESK